MDDSSPEVPAEVVRAIDADLDRRFELHAGDPLYDELKRVRRAELIAAARRRAVS